MFDTSTPIYSASQSGHALISPASGCFHLHSAEPLFHQLISMSGTSLLRARSPELIQRSFDRVTEIFGIQGLSPQEQVQQLLEVPISELRTKVGRQVPLGPMADGDLVHETTTYQGLANHSDFQRIFPGAVHCKRLLVGDCKMDVSHILPFPIVFDRTRLTLQAAALAPRLASRNDILPQTLAHCLFQALSSTESGTVVTITTAYGLDASSTVTANTQASTERVLNFGNDVLRRCGTRVCP